MRFFIVLLVALLSVVAVQATPANFPIDATGEGVVAAYDNVRAPFLEAARLWYNAANLNGQTPTGTVSGILTDAASLTTAQTLVASLPFAYSSYGAYGTAFTNLATAFTNLATASTTERAVAIATNNNAAANAYEASYVAFANLAGYCNEAAAMATRAAQIVH